MKNLIAYLTLLICIYANSQAASEILELESKSNEIQYNWMKKAEHLISDLIVQNKNLQSDVKVLQSKLEHQSNYITGLLLSSMRDSLKIDRLEKQISYTQSFIKDSIAFISINAEPIDTNLLADVSSINKAWTDNDSSSYSYDHKIANYQYLSFNLKENLKPKTTYIISFTIELEDTSREALINFWFYDDSGNTRLSDTYYGEGMHTIEVEFDVEKIRMAVRARNNDGGSFKLVNPKIESQ